MLNHNTTTNRPRIYVACLASYNNGILHGAWINADEGVDTMREEIAKLLRESPEPNVTVPCPECHGAIPTASEGDAWPLADAVCGTCKGSGRVPSAEEYAIHDYEGFGPIKLSEYEDLDTVAHMAEMIAEHGEAWAYLADDRGDHMLSSDEFQDAYQGEYSSEEDFAMQLADDLGAVPENTSWPLTCIDWEQAARELFMDGYTYEGGYVFRTY